MNPTTRAEELARRFNEDEAVWACFEEKRLLRKLSGERCPLREEMLDRLDWSEAERECREIRCIGFEAS